MSRVANSTVYFLVAPFVALTFVALSALTGCTKNDTTPGLPGAGATPEPALKVGPREVNLAIWANYLTPETAAKFTAKTGIKLNITNYSSNEELLAKVQAGAAGMDVAVPSGYMVAVLRKLDLLQTIDSSKVPNRSGIDPNFLNQASDPKGEYSIPYSWTSVGLAVNRDLYKGEIKSYNDLFTKADLAGKFSMLDDVREVTAAALETLGFSVNSTNPDELKKAQEILKKARKNVKMFTSDTIDPLVNKEVAVAQTYSSDALQAARKSKSKIEFFIPKEGGTRALDSLVVFKLSKNQTEALELINFLIAPETNLEFVTKNFGGPVVLETKKSLSRELAESSALYPSKDELAKLQSIDDVGEATRLYDRLWTELKTE